MMNKYQINVLSQNMFHALHVTVFCTNYFVQGQGTRAQKATVAQYVESIFKILKQHITPFHSSKYQSQKEIKAPFHNFQYWFSTKF